MVRDSFVSLVTPIKKWYNYHDITRWNPKVAKRPIIYLKSKIVENGLFDSSMFKLRYFQSSDTYPLSINVHLFYIFRNVWYP